MKKITVITFICISIFANAQTKVISKTPDIDTTFNTKLTGSFFIERKQIVGNQYLVKDWLQGKILLSTGDTIFCKSLKYSGLSDELIWLNNFNYGIFKLDKPLIKEFWLSNDIQNFHFKQINVSNSAKDSVKNIFAEVKTEGILSFYIQRKISYQWPQYLIVDNVRQKYEVIEPSPVYYFKLPTNQFYSLTNLTRKSFLQLFPENKKAITKIINDNRLNLKRESDLVRLVELINENQLFSK